MTLGPATKLLTAAMLCVQIMACSVVNYRKPVDDFAQATRNTEEALVGLNQQVTDGYAGLLRRRVVARELQAGIKKGDCRTDSAEPTGSAEPARCRLVVKDRFGKEELLTPDPAMGNMLILMGSIRTYSDGLGGIVNADTAAQVTTQVNATVGSVRNLAESVAKLGGPNNTPKVNLADYVTPAGDLVNWFVGQYIAKVQLDGLRRATVDARPVISGAADVFAAAANESANATRAMMSEEISQRIDALRTSANEGTIREAAVSAARYDQLLLAPPSAVFDQLKQSHEVLVAKIQDEKVTMAEVIAQIELFAAKAQELADIVKQLQAVGAKKPEG